MSPTGVRKAWRECEGWVGEESRLHHIGTCDTDSEKSGLKPGIIEQADLDRFLSANAASKELLEFARSYVFNIGAMRRLFPGGMGDVLSRPGIVRFGSDGGAPPGHKKESTT